MLVKDKLFVDTPYSAKECWIRLRSLQEQRIFVEIFKVDEDNYMFYAKQVGSKHWWQRSGNPFSYVSGEIVSLAENFTRIQAQPKAAPFLYLFILWLVGISLITVMLGTIEGVEIRNEGTLGSSGEQSQAANISIVILICGEWRLEFGRQG